MTGVRTAALSLLAALAAPAAAEEVAGPRLDYVLQCMGCHGADGRGAPDRVPTLVDEPARFLGVPGGRAYLVQVPGVAQAPLDDAEVAALLNWMLRSFSPGSLGLDFLPFTAEEVAHHRARRLDDPAAVRRALLARLDSAAAPTEAGSP